MKTIITEGSFTIDRTTLIYNNRKIIKKMVTNNMQADLIRGGEFIITAQEILDKKRSIPARCVNEYIENKTDKNLRVSSSIVTIVYNQQTR